MEVSKTAFWGRLLSILTAISEAHFVSIDLELSGVVSKSPSGRSHRQSLQERYAETKEAAERYTILQIGVTCAYEDVVKEEYLLRPYNFNLNPSPEEKLDLERIFSFQSGAVDFLLSHGFQMNLPFTHGVPYLSRDEARRAKVIVEDRLNRAVVKDIELKETEVQSLAFVERVRKKIQNWIKAKKPSGDALYIHGTSPLASEPTEEAELSRFEKRLVHQLVRSEFKDYTTISRPDSIKIIRTDPDRERDFRKTRLKTVREQIGRQTGFRWIIEALAGGSLERLDVRNMAVNPHTGLPCSVSLGDLHSRLGNVKETLKYRRPVLVGHNMFTDLIYLYKTFVGTLPDTVEEFTHELHELFPNIVDTKWLATQADSDIPSHSSLEQTEEKLRNAVAPRIEIHLDHPKYTTSNHFHEAGYDAYLTARVMILLSAKLEAAGEHLPSLTLASDSESYETAPEETGGVSLKARFVLTPIKEAEASSTSDILEVNPKGWTTGSPTGNEGSVVAAKKRKKKNKKKPASAVGSSTSSAFASQNMYSTLEQLSLEESPAQPDPAATKKNPSFSPSPPPRPSPIQTVSSQPPPTTISYVSNGTTYFVPASQSNSHAQISESKVIFGRPSLLHSITRERESHREQGQPLTFMPAYESNFWTVYGNRLRVYGTVEQVLKLGDGRR